MLILEEDVDDPPGNRLDRWFAAYATPGDVYLPLVMVDSGDRIDNGNANFAHVYRGMIDDALLRPWSAAMTVSSSSSASTLSFDIELTNRSGVTLSSANDATVIALVWEEPTSPGELPVVAASGQTPISTLEHGATATIDLEVDVTGLSAARIRWVVIAEFRPPDSDTAFKTLHAVRGP